MLTRLTRTTATLVLVLGLCTVAFELGARSGTRGLPPEFDALEQAYSEISTDAVETPPDDVLVEGAIEGMLGALGDEYAAFYDADEFAALDAQLDGRFVGIGVVLEDTEVGLTVQTVLPDSPAEAAGIEPGEEIVTVDGEDVTNTPSEVIVEKVRGEAGTEVVLGLRGGARGERTVTVVREELEVPNVEQRLEGDVGYVQLRSFTGDAGEEVRQAAERLLADGARGLVLDLRGNPGGYLPAAVDVAGVFVEEAEVVSVGSDPEHAEVYRTDDAAVAADVPLAVLVDGGSASASEIVAGAFADLDRAEIVGTKTFGKGTVQTITDLPDERGLKFTTARYYTPSGDSIDGVGVEPDVVVEEPQDVAADADPQLDAAVAAVDAKIAAAV